MVKGLTGFGLSVQLVRVRNLCSLCGQEKMGQAQDRIYNVFVAT